MRGNSTQVDTMSDMSDRTVPPSVTRVVVVTDGGVREFWADEWVVSVQDDGRTLKLFPTGNGIAARTEATRALAELMQQDLQRAQENTAAQKWQNQLEGLDQ